MTTNRTTSARPSTAAVLDPQAAREEAIRGIFRDQRKHLAALFPKDGAVMADRACAAAVSASRERDKKTGQIRLAGVTPEDIAAAVIAVHHMGLEVGEEAYLVPYGKTPQIIVGPKGLIKLMYLSGFVSSVEFGEVFGTQDESGRGTDPGADFFLYELGDAPFIKHRKGLGGRRGLGITHVYCIVKTTTGGIVRMVMTWEDVEFYRGFSKMADGPMWADNWGGAARKTILHRVADLLPRSPIMNAALRTNETGGIEIDEEFMSQVRAKMAASNGKPEPIVETVPAQESREQAEGS